MPKSLEEQCLEFGNQLGLDGPVPERVLRAALENEAYAYKLVVSSQNYDPRILRFLLENVPESDGPPPVHHSSMELAARAAKAMVRWSATGFARVDDETLEHRRQACLVCPHLLEPQTWPQKLLADKPRKDLPWDVAGKICELCGCILSKKIHLPSEICPEEDPLNPGRTRWGETFRKKKKNTP